MPLREGWGQNKGLWEFSLLWLLPGASVFHEHNFLLTLIIVLEKFGSNSCYEMVSDIKRNSDARQLVGDVVDIEDIVTYGEKQRFSYFFHVTFIL